MHRYKAFRKIDCDSNQYPNLSYPEVYVLDGGYRNFFNQFKVGRAGPCRRRLFLRHRDS